MRYFLQLSYKGSRYSGWQIQANAPTVQAELNRCLSLLFREEISTTGSGRTDAGVHATCQVVHFDLSTSLDDLPRVLYKLNAMLPADIAVSRLRPVADDAHARFDAVRRAYQYRIVRAKDPFLCHDAYYHPPAQDLNAIRSACEILKQHTDFEAFSRVKTEVNHFHCHIFEAQWEPTETGYVFYVVANRFLRGMVRAVVGTLLDIGEGRMAAETLEDILESRDRRQAGRAVPPEGLYLCEVSYPEHIYF
jgi:tRNA pseudouridine38-40 synthase